MAGKGHISLFQRRFMELMRLDVARDLVRKINRFTHEVETMRKPDTAKDSRLVQTFFSRMEADILRHRIWATLSDTDKQVMGEGVEEYVTKKLYKRLFGRYKEDQERDALISSRLFALQFVTPAHLDIPVGIIDDKCIQSPINELQKINAFKSPKDKLSCILNCCQSIMNLLHSAKCDTGADAFIPVLNYVVIKTQPIHLMSNIEFIKRFRMSSKLVGHADYYFTQLCAAAHFIELADSESFTDGRQEFLTSFLQQGLINWQQYEEALHHRRGEIRMPRSLSTQSAENISDSSQVDGDGVDISSVSDLKSLTENPTSTRGIDWTGFQTVSQLEREGQSRVNQTATSGELSKRHRFLSLKISELTVGAIEELLGEYKNLVVLYEVLSEAVMENETAAVLRMIREHEIKGCRHSLWPSGKNLLQKYSYLFSSFQDLSVKDVTQMFAGYKLILLKTECLISGIKRRIIHDLQSEDFEFVEAEHGENAVKNYLFPTAHEAGIVGGQMSAFSFKTKTKSPNTVPVTASAPASSDSPMHIPDLIALGDEEQIVVTPTDTPLSTPHFSLKPTVTSSQRDLEVVMQLSVERDSHVHVSFVYQ